MRRLWGLLGLILLLTALPLLAVSQLLPVWDEARWTNAAETTGQIVGFTSGGSGKKPLVSFVAANGDPYVFEANVYHSGMHMGQMVQVRYFLEPQLQASLKMDLFGAQLGLGISGCTLVALSFVSLLIQLRKSSVQKQLLLYGTRYEAVITNIETKCNVRINGRSPVVVTCTMRDPQGIGERAFRSGWMTKPFPFLRVGCKVPVLMDSYRPNQYLILTDEAEPLSIADTEDS